MQTSYINDEIHVNGTTIPTCNVGFFIPKAFYLKFLFPNGRQDSSTAKLAAYLLYWHKPKTKIDANTGEKIFTNKFFGNKFQTSYGFLTKELGLSKATIRRSFVNLEKHGYAKRVFEKVSLCGQSYNNRLFVELDDKFKEDFGLDEKFGVKRDVASKSLPSSSVGAGVIDVVPYAHGGKVIKNNNKDNNKDRFRSRSMESDLVFKNSSKEENEQKEEKEVSHITQLKEESLPQSSSSNITLATKELNLSDVSKEELLIEVGKRIENKAGDSDALSFADKGEAKKAVTTSKNGSSGRRKDFTFGRKRKTLRDYYPLGDEDCMVLQKKSGRGFSAHGINEIIRHLVEKDLDVSFFCKKGMISYISVALENELRSEEEVNRDDFAIGEVVSKEQQERWKQEKFLTEVENSLQVSPEWHLKKKLASCLSASKAYELLNSAYRYERAEDVFKIFLQKKVELEERDKKIILAEVNASHAGIGSHASFSNDSKSMVALDGIFRLELVLRSGEVVSSFENKQFKENGSEETKTKDMSQIGEASQIGGVVAKVVESFKKEAEKEKENNRPLSKLNFPIPNYRYLQLN